MNNQNIFQQLANQNDDLDFSEVISQENPMPATEFTESISTTPEKEISGNIFEQLAEAEIKRKDQEYGFLDTAKDVGQQIITKGIAGAAGAYGNVLDAFGLQPKEGKQLPGQEIVNNLQSDILDKMNRGEKPSIGELLLLSDDDILPTYSRLPNSNEFNKAIEYLSGIGEGKTPAGRIAGNASQFVGEGAVTGGGGKALLGLGLSGLAGQGIREAGGPESIASGTEIAGSILPSVISKKLIPSGKGAKDVVEAGRKIGLSEAQITPLIQGENKVAILSKVARKGSKTKELFGSIKEQLGDSYNTIKNSPQAKVNLSNADHIQLRREFGNIRNDLSKTLAASPDRESALNFIEKSIDTLRNVNVTPEYLINFWQDINKSVNWNNINGGKKALAKLKEPISNVLKKSSPKLAEDFELTNNLYSKYAQISKKLKPDLVDAFINKGEIVAGVPAALALIQGNPWIMGGLASESALRLLGREMLINPYFQNLGNKLVTNFNQSSLKGITQLVNQAKEYMERKHPDEDWSFLNEKD